MQLITKSHAAQLLGNHDANNGIEDTIDFKPVVKLFNPYGSGTWLISEMDDQGYMFGLCDLGMGTPEMGHVTLEELESLQFFGTPQIERDIHFEATKTLTEYAAAARELGAINA